MERRRHSRLYWERLVEEFERSDESAPAFAKRHRVHAATFRSWLYRLRRERDTSPSPAVGFVEVVPVSLPESPIQSSGVRLQLPGDLVVEVPDLPEPAYLAELCRSLAG